MNPRTIVSVPRGLSFQDWSEPGKMVVTYGSLPLILKQFDARLVHEVRPNGKLAHGTSRSPFSKTFLKKHEESVLRRAVTYDLDDMMSLAAVLSCCLHCHFANWPTAVEDFVRVLLLLPGMQPLVRSESDDIENFLCGSPQKNRPTSSQKSCAPSLEERNGNIDIGQTQLNVPVQNIPSPALSVQSYPSAVNSMDCTTSSKCFPSSSGSSRQLPFSMDNLLQETTDAGSQYGLSSIFNPPYNELVPYLSTLYYQDLLNKAYYQDLLSRAALGISTVPPFGANLTYDNPYSWLTSGSVHGNISVYATSQGNCAHGNAVIPPAGNSVNAAGVEAATGGVAGSEVAADGTAIGEVAADDAADKEIAAAEQCTEETALPTSHEMVPSHEDNAELCSPYLETSEFSEESYLSATNSFVSDDTDIHNGGVECNDYPIIAMENDKIENMQPPTTISTPSIAMEHYGSRGNVIRITCERNSDVVVYVHDGRLVVKCERGQEAKENRSAILMSRNLPENVDLGKACCRRTENDSTDDLEIFLPSLTPK